MTNKTIATMFASSFAICVLGYAADNGVAFFTLGGIGIIASQILATFRLFEIETDSILGYALAVSSILFWIAAISEAGSTLVGFTTIAVWVTGIWSIIRLYSTK